LLQRLSTLTRNFPFTERWTRTVLQIFNKVCSTLAVSFSDAAYTTTLLTQTGLR